jgi:hypothetical protein
MSTTLHIRRCKPVLLRGDSTMREESLWRRHEGHRNDWRSVFDSWVCRKVAKAMRTQLSTVHMQRVTFMLVHKTATNRT